MTFMRRPPPPGPARRRRPGALVTAASRPPRGQPEIPQRAGEQRHDPVLVQPGRVGGGQPAEQGAAQPGQFRQRDLAERGLDERALAGPAGRQALGLQLAVGLEHRVRIDGQRGDHIADLGQLIAGLEVSEPQRVLDLLDELQVGRHAGGGVEPELDRRRRSRAPAGRCCCAAARPGEASLPPPPAVTPLPIVIGQDYRRCCRCQARAVAECGEFGPPRGSQVTALTGDASGASLRICAGHGERAGPRIAKDSLISLN